MHIWHVKGGKIIENQPKPIFHAATLNQSKELLEKLESNLSGSVDGLYGDAFEDAIRLPRSWFTKMLWRDEGLSQEDMALLIYLMTIATKYNKTQTVVINLTVRSLMTAFYRDRRLSYRRRLKDSLERLHSAELIRVKKLGPKSKANSLDAPFDVHFSKTPGNGFRLIPRRQLLKILRSKYDLSVRVGCLITYVVICVHTNTNVEYNKHEIQQRHTSSLIETSGYAKTSFYRYMNDLDEIGVIAVMTAWYANTKRSRQLRYAPIEKADALINYLRDEINRRHIFKVERRIVADR